VLDLERRELARASTTVAVAPQVFDLLVYLVENRARVVGKDELLDAVWTGRIVSESTLASHINAARKAVGDSGQEQRVIRTIARKGFRFVDEVRDTGSIATSNSGEPVVPAPSPAAVLQLPVKPSIAVLPFVNLSGDPQQDYFADGVVEDVIAALSRYQWLFVIARNSSFAYRGRAVDVKQVGRELGVRYVLEGSMRKAQSRIRITGQLIDAATGAHHWADRFEGVLENIFELQDQITESVVGALVPQLERAEIERARHKPTENLDAYDYYLRGMARLHLGTKESTDQALPLFHLAIEADPEYASAYAMAAWCHCWRKVSGWIDDRHAEFTEGGRLARRAVELGKNDALALTRGGHALAHFTGDMEGGVALLERALVLNPNLAAAWFLGAYLRVWRGDTDGAIEYFAHAMRLSPLDPELYRMQAGMAVAHLFAGRFDVAASWAERALHNLPSFLMAAAVVAASHALAGRTADAQRCMARVRELDPALRIANVAQWLPIQRAEHLAAFTRGLRAAGLPES
jgi:TolB-like protein